MIFNRSNNGGEVVARCRKVCIGNKLHSPLLTILKGIVYFNIAGTRTNYPLYRYCLYLFDFSFYIFSLEREWVISSVFLLPDSFESRIVPKYFVTFDISSASPFSQGSFKSGVLSFLVNEICTVFFGVKTQSILYRISHYLYALFIIFHQDFVNH